MFNKLYSKLALLMEAIKDKIQQERNLKTH